MSPLRTHHALGPALLLAGALGGLQAPLDAQDAPAPEAAERPEAGAPAEPAASEPAGSQDARPAAPGAEARAVDGAEDDVLLVGPGGLTLYPRWNKAFPPVAELAAGTRLEVLRRLDAWSHVQVPPGQPRGWVYCEVRPVLADGRALQLPIAASPTTSGLVVKGFSPRRYALAQPADADALEALLARDLDATRYDAFLADDPTPAPTFGSWYAQVAAADAGPGARDRDDAAAERARAAAEQAPDAELPDPDDARGALIAELDAAKRGLLGRNALRGDIVAALGPEGARALGEAVAARVLASTPLHASATLHEYVSFVGLRLAEHAPAPPDSRWVFTVIDSDEPNAFSTAGGFVFVTTGALQECDNEAQLAALLAHELAHVARGHALRSLDTARHRIMLDAARTELTRALPESSPAHRALIDDLTAACDSLYERSQAPLSQAFEGEADALALHLLWRAGYDPREAVALLDTLAAAGSERHALSSHPAPGERAADLRGLLAELGLPTGGSVNAARLQAHVGAPEPR